MPAGLEATVPEPLPFFATVKLKVCVKLAVHLLLALVVTDAVVAVPVQSPDQPAKIEPAAGAAVNLTTVPDA
jgi:hypothetical protein